jgi:hypothetical protein
MFRSGLSALASAALVATFTLSARAALADAVMGPPEDCPPGSSGRSSHRGPFCAPTTCETDADCERQMSYRDRDRGRKFECKAQVSVCIEQKDFTSWRRRPADGAKTMLPVAVSACGRGATCAGTAVCETARRCVDTGAPAPPPSLTRAVTGGATTTAASGGPSSSSHGAGADIPPGKDKGCGCAASERVDATVAAAVVLCGIGLLVARRRSAAGRSSLD